jgi:hypothetical protein
VCCMDSLEIDYMREDGGILGRAPGETVPSSLQQLVEQARRQPILMSPAWWV